MVDAEKVDFTKTEAAIRTAGTIKTDFIIKIVVNLKPRSM